MGLNIKNPAVRNIIFPKHMKQREIGLIRNNINYEGQLVIRLGDALHSLSQDKIYWSDVGLMTLEIELLPRGTELVID